jgi:hypothetical protein
MVQNGLARQALPACVPESGLSADAPFTSGCHAHHFGMAPIPEGDRVFVPLGDSMTRRKRKDDCIGF